MFFFNITQIIIFQTSRKCLFFSENPYHLDSSFLLHRIGLNLLLLFNIAVFWKPEVGKWWDKNLALFAAPKTGLKTFLWNIIQCFSHQIQNFIIKTKVFKDKTHSQDWIKDVSWVREEQVSQLSTLSQRGSTITI